MALRSTEDREAMYAKCRERQARKRKIRRKKERIARMIKKAIELNKPLQIK